jgi:hypothetical protein
MGALDVTALNGDAERRKVGTVVSRGIVDKRGITLGLNARNDLFHGGIHVG